MKRSLLINSIALSFLAASTLSCANTINAAGPGNTTALSGKPMVKTHIPLPHQQHVTPTHNSEGVPLNRYGAVNVNANVPYSKQVPNEPKGFKNPEVTSLVSHWKELIPAQPKVKARSYMLVSAQSGQVLAAYNPNHREAPASLTKLMLLYITAKELSHGIININDKVRVPKVAWATGGSRMFLKPATHVEVRKLISGIVVDSGNDAAVTLAKYIAGDQNTFVSLMNQTAKKLGMTNSHFSDVMGLPAPDLYTSAHDMAILARHIIVDYPQYVSWYKQYYFTYDHITQPNFNRLLFIDKNALGMKTGSTNEAGYSLVGAAKQPHNPMTLISVVMGSTSAETSATTSKALLTYGFRYFRDKELYAAKQVIKKPRVYMGKNKYLPIGTQRNLWVTLPRGNDISKKLSAQLKLKKVIKAPIETGETVGHIVVDLDGKQLRTAPVVALANDPKGDWFRRAYDTIALWF